MLLLVVFALLGVCVGAEVTTVHIIPHTHDDVGWLKTLDEYYLGANQSIYQAGVQYILDAVIPELENDPSKTFVYVEIAFFTRWWYQQDQAMQSRVKVLVQNKQLTFVGGGWCMNDESAPSDEAIITQMTLGHKFLKETFDLTPNIGWQVDPFGHSNTMMSLFAQMGFSSVFFARMDYQDYDLRKNESRLEFVWRPSQSLGKKSDIFAHQMWDLTYCWPDGFNFEGGDQPINGDPAIEGVNIQQRSEQFVVEMQKRIPHYRTGSTNLFVAFGCDFAYQNANINYKNMDKVMKYVNERPEFNMKIVYSSPDRYIEAVHAEDLSWTLKTDDIFPYADRGYSYWTGYMTSRPALKGYVRSRNALLRSADKLIALFSKGQDLDRLLANTLVLRKAFSVAQHHDAVAGTEKQHVADDYAKLLANGTVAVESALAPVLANVTGSGGSTWHFCPYMNISVCPPLTDDATANKGVTLFNSLGWNRTEGISVAGSFTVEGLESQTYMDPFSGKPMTAFLASVPAFGVDTYTLKPKSLLRRAFGGVVDDSSFISNAFYNLTFGGADGALSTLNGRAFGQDFLWYNESAGNNVNSTQAGGAYIFRPNSTVPFPTHVQGVSLNLKIEKGPVFESAELTYSDWVKVYIRLWKDRNFVEFTSKIGPIPFEDGMGKNVVHRYQTFVNNGQTFYTDSSFEEMQTRVYNHRESWTLNVTNPVAGNYYPMNQAAVLKDSTDQIAVLSDRSRGCASLSNGQFESMLHRRLLFDDARGVGEALNETEAIITTERVLRMDPSDPSFRSQAMELNHPFLLAVSGAGFQGAQAVAPGLLKPLPMNVHVVDFYHVDQKTAVFRIRHLYGVDEPAPWSNPVSINLDEYLVRRISILEETQLTTVQDPQFVANRLKWRVDGEGALDDGEESIEHVERHANAFQIDLAPMQIRTFFVTFE